MSMNNYPLPLSSSTPKVQITTQTSTKIAWEDKTSPIQTREFTSHQDETELLKKELDRATSTSFQTTKSPKAKGPKTPEWAVTRPFLSNKYLQTPYRNTIQTKTELLPITSYPPSTQEQIILDDLLFILMGIDGKYIKLQLSEDETPHFTVDPSIEGSIAALVQRTLPICQYYLRITSHLLQHSQYDYGMVNHALCAAVHSLIKEYLVVLAQLETVLKQGKLTLQKFWYYLQPPLRTLEIIDKVLHECSSLRGGALVNQLYKTFITLAGDKQTRELMVFLLEKSSVPFFEMVEKWIYKGIVRDPYLEFFVVEREDLKKENINEDYNDVYWEERFTLQKENLPSFFTNFGEKILVTGKYLNVIRECGIDIHSSVSERFFFSTNEREYSDKIETAYKFASNHLLDHLLQEKKLIDRLRSIKHYFLLDQGDFFVHFLDIAESELKKLNGEISLNRLNSLLELSLRTSCADSDPYKDDLNSMLLPYNLMYQLLKIIHVGDKSKLRVDTAFSKEKPGERVTGNDSFTFDYKVQWPLSLIISRKSLTKYQLLFRLLFLCKRVERIICNVWVQHQSTRELHLRAVLASSYRLRQKMLHFLQNLQYYITFEVLEPNWHLLEQNLRKATTIDEVLQYHGDFLDTCLTSCMLTDRNLVKLLHSIMALCGMYAEKTTSIINSLNLDIEISEKFQQEIKEDKKKAELLRRTKIKVASEQAKIVLQDKSYTNALQKLEGDFTQFLGKLIDHLNGAATIEANNQMANLALRLDFNGYYRESLEKRAEM